jgi:hypothetical protein
VDGSCPAGQSCSAGTCTFSPSSVDAAPVDDASGGGVTIADRDGDGVADDKDNCPDKKNADQVNEDGDARGDACDVCPQISGDPGTDSDGDGIGDVCDPSAGKDTVWLYDGFHSGLPGGWGKTSHWMWMSATGTVQAMAAGNGTDGSDSEWLITSFVSPVNPPDNFSVTMTVVVDQMTGSNGDHSVGIEIWDQTAMSNTGAGVDCWLDQFPAGSNSMLILDDDFNNPHLSRSTSYPWTVGGQYRLTMTRHGGTYTCTVVGPNGSADTKSLSGPSVAVPRDGYAVDIWAFGATARYGSVQIVGTP